MKVQTEAGRNGDKRWRNAKRHPTHAERVECRERRFLQKISRGAETYLQGTNGLGVATTAL